MSETVGVPEGFDPDQVILTTAGQIMEYAAEAWNQGLNTAWDIAEYVATEDSWPPYAYDVVTKFGYYNPYVQHETIEVNQ